MRSFELESDSHCYHLYLNPYSFSATILRALRAGTHVIMDRYAFSGVAFSAAKPGLDAAWCAAPDAGLPAPDAVLFMDLAPAAQAARSGFGGERYESAPFQIAVRAAFAALKERAPRSLLWIDIDADGCVEDVAARVDAAADEIFATAATSPVCTLWDGKPL